MSLSPLLDRVDGWMDGWVGGSGLDGWMYLPCCTGTGLAGGLVGARARTGYKVQAASPYLLGGTHPDCFGASTCSQVWRMGAL